MHLLSSLNAGFAAAPLGWAEIYIRGTSTRATWYADFEGNGANSTGANISLDAYGSALVYVNQLVDVVVKEEDGTVVRQYGDGYAAPNIEVVSDAFTGADYDTAAVAVGEPTTLQAVLDRWETNSGAPDWKVAVGGTATTLEDALGVTAGLVFNVKSPVYGAVGDGVTNDQAAITAAMVAAVAAGGGIVFFPKGTYLITSAMEWDHRVSIVGVGGGLSIITTNSAANARIITFTAGTALSSPIRFSGMGFAASQANTGEQIYCNVAVNLVVEKCWLGATGSATGILANLAGSNSKITFRDCRFTVNSTTNYVLTAATSASLSVERCLFITAAASFTGALVRTTGPSTFTNCTFDISTVAAGSPYAIEMAGAALLTVQGCQFITSAVAFVACLDLMATSVVNTLGNSFGASPFYELGAGVVDASSQLQFNQATRVESATLTQTIPNATSVYVLEGTSTDPVLTAPQGFIRGQTLCVRLRNGSGGNWVGLTFNDAVFSSGLVSYPALTSGANMTILLVYDDSITAETYAWRVYYIAP